MPSGLVVPVREDAATAAAERVRQTRQAGFRAELLARDELMRVEQQLRHDGPALHFPGDGSIHPLKLAAGVSRALRREGVRICPGQEVEDVTAEGPVVKTRTASIAAGSVVVTAGAWTPLVTRLLGWSPPIRPVRGILLATEARPARTLRTVVVGDRYYYWQLRSGHLAGGGSEEDVGFARGVSPAVARDIVRDWRDRFPGLRDARFTARWSGFRPRCADLQPVIGRIPGGGRTYVAAGHFRKGVLLAPLTGELVAEELLEGQTWTLARAMRPERFPRHAPPGRRGARA